MKLRTWSIGLFLTRLGYARRFPSRRVDVITTSVWIVSDFTNACSARHTGRNRWMLNMCMWTGCRGHLFSLFLTTDTHTHTHRSRATVAPAAAVGCHRRSCLHTFDPFGCGLYWRRRKKQQNWANVRLCPPWEGRAFLLTQVQIARLWRHSPWTEGGNGREKDPNQTLIWTKLILHWCQCDLKKSA